MTEIQEKLLITHLNSIRRVAHRVGSTIPQEIEDLVYVGFEAAIEASTRYNNTLNDSFWGYAYLRIEGAMRDYLRSLDVHSRADRTMIKKINSLTQDYLQKFDRLPEQSYLAQKLEITEDKLLFIQQHLNQKQEVCIGEQCYEHVEDEVAKHETMELIQRILSDLGSHEQEIVRLVFFEEQKRKDIAEQFGYSESSMSQFIARLMRSIKEKLKDEGIEDNPLFEE